MPRPLRLLVACALAALSFAAPTAGAATGDLKYFRIYPSLANGSFPAGLNAIAAQPDGKVVVAGYAYQQAGAGNIDWVVARMDSATGILDAGFGQNGIVRLPMDLVAGGADIANAVAIGPGGRIVVVGEVQTAGGSDVAAVALTSTGEADGSFGPSGLRTFDFGTLDSGTAVYVNPGTGAVTIGGSAGESPPGFAIARVDSSGEPLAGFGAGGKTVTPLGGTQGDQVAALVPASDGTILAVGTKDVGFADSDIAFVRYDGAGQTGDAKLIQTARTDTVADAVMAADEVYVADSAVESGAPIAYLQGFSAALDPIDGFGGQTFGSASTYSGLVLGPSGTVLGLGTAPFGGAKDDLWLARLDGNGKPVTPARNYPGTAGAQEAGGDVAFVGDNTTGVALVAGRQNDVPAMGAIDQSAPGAPGSGGPGGGGTTPPPGPNNHELSVSLTQKAFAGATKKLAVDSAGALRVPHERYGQVRPVVYAATQELAMTLSVINNGQATSPATKVTVDVTLPGSALRGGLLKGDAPCEMTKSTSGIRPYFIDHAAPGLLNDYGRVDVSATLTCDVPALASGAEFAPVFLVLMAQRLPMKGGALVAVAPCNAAGEAYVCDNNRAELKLAAFIDPASPPRTTAWFKAASGKALKGEAGPNNKSKKKSDSAKRVQVAIVRLGSGARAIHAAASPPQCTWLKSATGKTVVRDAQSGLCLNPVWLTAKGTARWRFTPRKRLPKGSYEAIVRAVDRKGRTQRALPPPSHAYFTVK
jgi:uncharacterized delta-60 repeat protein